MEFQADINISFVNSLTSIFFHSVELLRCLPFAFINKDKTPPLLDVQKGVSKDLSL